MLTKPEIEEIFQKHLVKLESKRMELINDIAAGKANYWLSGAMHEDSIEKRMAILNEKIELLKTLMQEILCK